MVHPDWPSAIHDMASHVHGMTTFVVFIYSLNVIALGLLIFSVANDMCTSNEELLIYPYEKDEPLPDLEELEALSRGSRDERSKDKRKKKKKRRKSRSSGNRRIPISQSVDEDDIKSSSIRRACDSTSERIDKSSQAVKPAKSVKKSAPKAAKKAPEKKEQKPKAGANSERCSERMSRTASLEVSTPPQKADPIATPKMGDSHMPGTNSFGTNVSSFSVCNSMTMQEQYALHLQQQQEQQQPQQQQQHVYNPDDVPSEFSTGSARTAVHPTQPLSHSKTAISPGTSDYQKLDMTHQGGIQYRNLTTSPGSLSSVPATPPNVASSVPLFN